MKAIEIEMIVKAALAAMERDGGEIGFAATLKRFKLGEEKLEIWLSAYEEGGFNGIRALVESFAMPAEVVRAAQNQIRSFFQAAWPEWSYKVNRRSNSFTISVKKPGQERLWEICQLRYTPFDGRWHLYWKRASGKWCPYAGDGVDADGQLWKILYLLQLDEYGCFTELDDAFAGTL